MSVKHLRKPRYSKGLIRLTLTRKRGEPVREYSEHNYYKLSNPIGSSPSAYNHKEIAMIDFGTLPDQFPDVPADLSRMQAIFWSHWMRGNTPSDNELSAPGTNELYQRFKAEAPCTAPDVDITQLTDAQLKRAEYEQRSRRIKQARQNPLYRTIRQADVTTGVGKALDAGWSGQKQTATEIMRDTTKTNVTGAYMGRTHQKDKLKRALTAHVGHPAVQYAKQQGNAIHVDGDTLSNGLLAIQNAADVFRKLNDHEQRLNDMEARMRELEAFKANTEKRHAIEDAGQTPEQRVVELRKQGLGYKAISTATGTSQSTVRNWVKAHGL